jgi:hypothetical protein
MILKELDLFRGSEADVAARLQADRMAYCLRRHFKRSAEVDVLNELRVPSGHVFACIDHLLVHSFGFLLIAREPVSEALSIDGEGGWQRREQGALVDIGSPITRAYVQILLMKSFLDRRVQQRGFFDRLELDVLVVVPDEVPIQWPVSGPLVEVCRREEVLERSDHRLRQLRQAAGRAGPLTASERQKLGDFLCRSHTPAT